MTDHPKLDLTIDELQCLGYTVEAIGHHPGLQGKFRWTNTHTFESQNVDEASTSEAEAWVRAAEAWGDRHNIKGLLSATQSGGPTPAQLEGHYSRGGANGGGEHPIFTRSAWRKAVGDGATVTGYWAWLASEIKQGHLQAEIQRLPRAERQLDWLGARH